MIPAPSLHRKFGNPYQLVEFRIFSFNTCGAGCKNCFYQKTKNDFKDFDSALSLARELKSLNYSLETCYILPTDVFENEFNYRVFENPSLRGTLDIFNYVGFASTLRNGFDQVFFDRIYAQHPHIKIELQVNLLEDQIFNDSYVEDLVERCNQLRQLYGSRILINLALNTGTPFSNEELERLKHLAANHSDDSILELNFTFLFNDKIPKVKKAELLRNSYSIIQFLSREFRKNENPYNDRTILRKPSFFFRDGFVYVSPIIPFDEYVFIEEDSFRLNRPDFSSFLDVYDAIEKRNKPLWKECDSCENLKVCQGKGFFAVADHFELGCIKEGI